MAEATAVLDASALLAFPRREPGFEVVLDAIGQGALMSAVNWAEVLTKLADLGEDLQRAVAEIESQGVLGSNLRIVAFGHDDALVCADSLAHPGSGAVPWGSGLPGARPRSRAACDYRGPPLVVCPRWR